MLFGEIQQLEVDTRRLIRQGVLHPDCCQKLEIGGVGFSVQPLSPAKGARFAPSFNEGKVEVRVEEPGIDVDEEIQTLAAEVAQLSRVVGEKVCPTCGVATSGGKLQIDFGEDGEFLSKLFEYAGKILRKQYEVSDEQLGKLLAFSGDVLPEWIVSVVRHSLGLPLGMDEVSIEIAADIMQAASVMAEGNEEDG